MSRQKRRDPGLNSGTYKTVSGHMHLSATKELWFVECDSQEWVLDHEKTNENNKEITPFGHYNPW